MEILANGIFSEVETGVGKSLDSIFFTFRSTGGVSAPFLFPGDAGVMIRPAGKWAEPGIVSSPCCCGDRVLVVAAVVVCGGMAAMGTGPFISEIVLLCISCAVILLLMVSISAPWHTLIERAALALVSKGDGVEEETAVGVGITMGMWPAAG